MPLLLKKLKMSPVVAIQGPRQVGKSFLVKQLLSKQLKFMVYQSFDDLGIMQFAETNPVTFLDQFSEALPLVIDEAQKAPEIFDAVKLAVDNERRPGKFILLGSTEFSKLTRIRESLTGRMSRLRLFPFTLSESLHLPIFKSANSLEIHSSPRATRRQLLTYLERGGMPGIFAVRSDLERRAFSKDWLDLTAGRDIHQFHGVKLDSTLCQQILQQVATIEEPTAGNIARLLKKDLRRIHTHLQILSELFVLHRLDPHPLGAGKPLYFFMDVGFAHTLGASFERRLHTWVILEAMSRIEYLSKIDSHLYFYRTSRGRFIHLLIENQRAKTLDAIKIFPEEKVSKRDLSLLLAFKEKVSNKITLNLVGLGAHKQNYKSEGIHINEWESIG